MKFNLKKIMLILMLAILLTPVIKVNAAVSTAIVAGGEKLEYDYNTSSNHNKTSTADFRYSDEYPGGLLTLSNYNGGKIEINHMVGVGTVEENPKPIVIKLEGENYINSDDVAISSNINIEIIGNGILNITAKELNNNNIDIKINNSVKINSNNNETTEPEENEVTEDNEEPEETNKENDFKEILVITSLISFILLCVLGCILIVIKINKNLKK